MRPPALLTAPLALLAIAAPGCGGDDDEPGRTLTVPAAEAIAVDGDEYSFDPETIVVEAGGEAAELTLRLRNTGALAHNLIVKGPGGEDLGGTPTFTGGETREASVTLEPGDYSFVCTVGNHEELGMTGELVVR